MIPDITCSFFVCYSHHCSYRVQYTSVHYSCRYSSSDRLSCSYTGVVLGRIWRRPVSGATLIAKHLLCSAPIPSHLETPLPRMVGNDQGAQMIGCLPDVLSLKDCSSCLLKKSPLCWWNIFQHSSFTNEHMESTRTDNVVTSCTVRWKNRSKLYIVIDGRWCR